jgi:hypothetical protein
MAIGGFCLMLSKAWAWRLEAAAPEYSLRTYDLLRGTGKIVYLLRREI